MAAVLVTGTRAEAMRAAMEACCCGSGSGSGSGRFAFSCEEAGACFSTATTIYGTWTIGDLCTNITEHNGFMVDPDPPEVTWLVTSDPLIQGYAWYVTIADGSTLTEDPCGEDPLTFSYTFLCIDRLIDGVTVSTLEFAANINGVTFYHCTDFEILSCDPLMIDTGDLSPVEGSGSSIRVVLST